jgi:hypothetical protein
MKKDVLKVGTLLTDNGKMGIISKVVEIGQLRPEIPIVSWRANYEITYVDGTILLLSCKALEAMVRNGVVVLHETATTHLPPSFSSLIPATTGEGDHES